MKKLKFEILFIILIMTVGIATVSTNVAINGSTPIASNPDDFNVYFSSVSVVDSDVDIQFTGGDRDTISFNATLESVGQKASIDFNITNASLNYDAGVSISCTASDEYLSISTDMASNVIESSSTGTGVIYIQLLKSYAGETALEKNFSCTLTTSAVERTTLGDENSELPEKLEIISFSVDGKTYSADSGMTWIEWVYSVYNTDEFVIDGEYLENSDGFIVEFQEYSVNIVPGRNYRVLYYFEYVHQDSYTGEVYYASTLSFYKGMTWGEWVNSDLNTGECPFTTDGSYVYNCDNVKIGPKASDEIIKDYSYVVYYTP